MRTVKDEAFVAVRDAESGLVIRDVEFRGCSFTGCSLSVTRDPGLRTLVRNVALVGCEQRGCGIYTAVLEDVAVNTLKSGNTLWCRGTAFRHVTLTGRLGAVCVQPIGIWGNSPDERMAVQRVFEEVNAAYYSGVDWAIDISRAEFSDCDIHGIPARLIRRDPESQVIITRQKILEGAWRTLDFRGTHLDAYIKANLDWNDPDLVLVAPRKHRKYNLMREQLKELRELGVAEPE